MPQVVLLFITSEDWAQKGRAKTPHSAAPPMRRDRGTGDRLVDQHLRKRRQPVLDDIYENTNLNSTEPNRPLATLTGHITSVCPECGQEHLEEVALAVANLGVDCHACGLRYYVVLATFTPMEDDDSRRA
jgi:hypothetical protein